MSDLFRAETRRAAKVHRCDECGAEITIGERYSAWFQLFDGDAYGGHTCLRCAAMRAEAWSAFNWFGAEEAPSLGELRMTLKDEYAIADPDAWLDTRLELRTTLADALASATEATASYQTGGHPA